MPFTGVEISRVRDYCSDPAVPCRWPGVTSPGFRANISTLPQPEVVK